MSDETFAALVKRLKPNASVRGLESGAGLNAGAISSLLKRSKGGVAGRQHMPKRDVILGIARALECEPSLVVRALANDLRIPLDELELSVEEVRFVELLRELSPRDRRAVRMLAENLAGKEPGDAS